MTIGGDEEIPVDEVAALGARRLAQIIVDHAYHSAGLLQTVRMALAATHSNDELARTLAAEIDTVRSDDRFYNYRQSRTMAHKIDRIRAAITRDLVPRAPPAAAELLERLIRLDGHIFEHADDSDGVIGDTIRDTVIDFGRAWAAVPERNVHHLATLVLVLFAQDDYGTHGEVIAACKDALGPEGLIELERLIRARVEAVPVTTGDDCRGALVRGLAEIADARGDVDGFIAAQRLAGGEGAGFVVKDMAERLVSAGRLVEALQCLDQAERRDRRPNPLDELKIGILERLGRTDEAQAIRWAMFLRSISATVLEDYLGQLPEGARAAATEKAIAIARQHRDAHAALSLLVEFDPLAAADLVVRRLAELSGDAYLTLRHAAECLAEAHPLASVLLYRRLAEAVLTRAQSQHYRHGVRDLLAAESLAPRVLDWLGHLPQDTYRTQIAQRHKQKSAFWKQMTAAGLNWQPEASEVHADTATGERA